MSDFVDNIVLTYLSATEDEHAQGMAWYDEAHNIAAELSPGDVWRGAGVIAAYSPLTPWWRNLELAIDSLNSGIANPKSLGNSVKAAQRILDGEPVLDVLKGDKTRAFAAAIADPVNSTIATIDRHAFDIAHNRIHVDSERRIGKRVFRAMSDAYVETAELAGISVAQIQAITWVAWRRRKGIVNRQAIHNGP